jgi:hypothetical protein
MGPARIATRSTEEAVSIDAAPYSAGDIACVMNGRISNDTPR